MPAGSAGEGRHYRRPGQRRECAKALFLVPQCGQSWVKVGMDFFLNQYVAQISSSRPRVVTH
jgi:Ni/Co efflux regulator RcnB